MREIALVFITVVTACARKAPVDPAPAPVCGGAPAGPAAEPARAPRPILQGAHAGAVTSMRFSPGGRYLATASDDETVKVWDAEQRSVLRTFRVLESDRFSNLQVEWDGEERLVYTQFLETPVVLDLATGASRERDDWGVSPMVPLAGGGWAGYLYEGKGKLSLVTIDPRGQRTQRRVADRLTQLVASRDGTTLAGWSRWTGKRDPSSAHVVVWRDGAEEVIDTGSEEIGPVALTPAGDALVAAVDTGAAWAVRVFPRGAGAKRARCELREKEKAGDVHDLAVSASGRLAAGAVSGADSSSLVLWDLDACRELWRVDESYARSLVRVAFAPGDERLVAGGELGEMRAFDVDGGRERGSFGAVVRPVFELAFTDDDTLVVKGIRDVRAWSLRDGRALARVGLPDERWPSRRLLEAGEGGGLVTVAATPTRCDGGAILRVDAWPGHDALDTAVARDWPLKPGQRLEVCIPIPSLQVDSIARGVAALLAHDEETKQPSVVRLPGGEVQPLDPVPGLEPPLPAKECPLLALSPDGAWAATTCSGVAGVVLWNARNGRVERLITVDRGPDQRASADAVVFARDGSAMAVGSREIVEVLALPGLERVHRVTMAGWPSALALSSARGLLVAGGRDGTVEAFRDGVRAAWRGPADEGLVTDVVISPGGSRVASVGVDGAIRVRDALTGSLQATLADFQDEEWVMTTPGGAFTGTTEVGDRVGWVFEEPLEYFGFEQFARFRDPALLRRRLAGEEVDITGRPGRPPRVELSASAPSGGRARLRVQVTADARVDTVRAFVEGRPVAAKPLCARAGAVELEVPLGQGVNRVSVAAFDARGLASNLASIDLRGPERAAAPDAWVVAVGVSDYPHLPRSMQLAAADDDARGIAAAFQRMGGGAYRAVHATTLIDAAATPAAIRAALDGLAKMKPEDVAVVFLAGHGFKPDARADMVFATGGAALRPDGRGLTVETLRDHALSWRDIARGIARARGRVVVLLDACHAGHVTQELVVANDALADGLVRQQRAGAVVFAAAKGRQQSYEISGGRGLVLRPAAPTAAAAAPSHGFFTGALLRALGDPATDRNRDGALQLSEVIDDVTRRVTETSEGTQTPRIARRDLFGDFALAPSPPSK
ncbi:MAG TPA: caspase family protein [Kofleriaceae bacterium]|nr:caspase family protein [Kofleriaceae bacterium]